MKVRSIDLQERLQKPALGEIMITHEKQFKTIDEYIKTFPEDVQSILERMRQTIRKAAPEASHSAFKHEQLLCC